MILAVCANPTVDRVYFVDRFNMGDVHRPVNVSVTAGGKGVNVAKVAATLGASSVVTGFLGGFAGEFISSELKKTDVTDAFLRTGKETRTCVNISDASGRSGEVLESGAELDPDDELKFIEHFKNLACGADIIVISGSQQKGLSDDFYVKLTDIARSCGKRCIVDASGETLARVTEAKPFMVKPNRDELSRLVGFGLSSISDCKDALLELRRKGVRIPFCTLGADGALMYYDERFIRFVIPSVQAVNTVGSGDSVVAGISVGLTRDMPLPDAVRYGMAAGISNALHRATGCVDKPTVDRYFKEVKLEYI